MKLDDAANILAKIGNPTRLKIVRLLVRAGDNGLAVGGSFVGIVMLWLCFRFSAAGERKAAQQLFFYTLLYLPLALGLLAIGWKQG